MTYEELKRKARGNSVPSDKEEKPSYEDLKEKVYGSKGTTADQAGKPSYEEIYKKVYGKAPTSYGTAEEFQSRLEQYNRFFEDARTAYEGIGYSNADAGYTQVSKQWERLEPGLEELLNWAEELEANGHLPSGTQATVQQNASKFRENACALLDGYQNARDYYAQWDTEDAYNEYAAVRDFDADAAQREIDVLESVLEDYRMLTRFETNEEGQARKDAIVQRYGSEKDLQALITRKQQALRQTSYAQEGMQLAQAAGNADFSGKSGYKSTISDSPSKWESGVGDTQYEWINNQNGFRQAYEKTMAELERQTGALYPDVQVAPEESAYRQKGYDLLRDDEVAIYNYYYSTEGKEKAQKYLDSLQEQLNYRKAQGIYGKIQGDDGVDLALQMIFGAEAGVDQFASGIGNLINTEDDYIPYSATQMASGMVREGLADNGPRLPEALGGASLGQVAYDTITTSANMAPSLITSAVVGAFNPLAGQITGSVLLGASASGSAYQEMLNRGYTKGQARAYSLLVGGSEAGLQLVLGGFQKLGGLAMKPLTNMLDGVDNAFFHVALKLGGEMLSEGAEEGLQEVLTPWFQNLVLHTNEEVNWSEVAYSSLLGALTAGFMEGSGTVSQGVKDVRTGEQLIFAGASGRELAQIGSTFAADTVAYKLAGRVNENTGAYTLGRLFNAIDAAMTEQNITAVTEALVNKGWDRATAQKNVRAFAGVVEGTELPRAAATAMEANTGLTQAVRDTVITPNTTQYQREQGHDDALMQLAQEMSAPNASRTEQELPGSENAPVTEPEDASAQETAEPVSEAERVQAITAIKNGVATVRLEDGTEVEAGKALLDPDEGAMIRTLAKIDGISAEDANYIAGVLRAAPVMGARFDALAAREAYTYGYYGYDEKSITDHGVFAMEFPEDLRRKIYRTGREARKRQTARESKTAEAKKAAAGKSTVVGKVHFDGDREGLTERQRVSLDALEHIAQALGVQIHVFESEVGADGKRVGANGWYDPKDGSIHIDLHAGADGAGTMLFTAAHELTHFIRQWSPEKFQVLADFLMEEYGKKGTDVDYLVRNQMEQAMMNGRELSYEDAFEEVVADSMETMLADGKVLEKLKQKDQTLWEKIKEFINELAAKIRKVYDSLAPDSAEGKIVAEMADAIGQMQELFAEALAEAGENFQAAMESVVKPDSEAVSDNEILTDDVVVTNGEGQKYSIRSMKADIAEGQMFEDLKAACGWTDAQVNTLRDQLGELVAYMTPYRDILDMNETYGREGRRFSPYKPNSDPLYTISMDFSTLCSKRLLTQYVIENLQLRENRPMTAEEQMAIRDMLNEYRKVEKGLQVACAMCYVEAARLKSPKQMSRWLSDPEPLLRDYFGKKNKAFNDSVREAQADFKESRGYPRTATKKDMKPADVKKLNEIGPKMRREYRLSREEQAIIERAKALPNSTYLTAANLASLSETEPVIYDAYTAFVRTATRSKSLETDVPYYYGDSGRDNGNGIVVTDSFIESVNRENGMRFSSWSDWRIQHMLDYITAVIDNSVRGAAMHGYTKFGDEVRVLGKTGMMFNMSGVAGTQTGLNEDGSLSFSPTESIDVDEAVQLREEFPETAGLQCIGVSDEHITALLRSDIIDYIIPYHTSGLNAGLRRMANIHGWKDYTSTQHAAIDKSQKLEDAADKEHWHEEPVYSEFFVGYDTGMTGIEAMRESAERYKQMCAERGLKPKFEKFADEDNYWKLLIDRKMINQKTGELIRQKPVTPTFDFNTIRGVVDRYVQNYDSNLEARALNHIVENWDSIPQRIRDLKKQSGKKSGGKSVKKSVDTLANQTLAAQPVEAGVKYSMRDSHGRQLSEDQQEFFADSRARDEFGNLHVLYHGSRSPLFTEFDVTEGVWLTTEQDYAEEYAEKWKGMWADGQPETRLEPVVYGKSDYRIYEMYANITNPLALGEINDEIDRKQISRLAKLVGAPVGAIRKIAFDTSGNLMLTWVYQITRTKEFIDLARAKGYDGFTASEGGCETFCAFNAPNQVKLRSNEVPSGFNDIRYQERSATSNRTILTEALETVAHPDEKRRLQEYKGKITELEVQEQKLREIRKEIQTLSFAKGKRDTKRIGQLRDEATMTANRISIVDAQLLRLEATAPLKAVLEREGAKIRTAERAEAKAVREADRIKAEARQNEIRREYREAQAALRQAESDTAIMEREFIRIAKIHEIQEARAAARFGKDAKTILDLKTRLRDEARNHRQDQKLWEKEFNRLMREYEAADRNIGKLEEKIQHQRDAAKRKVESRRKTEMREKIRKFKGKLEAQMLAPTDRQYIPAGLVSAMVDVCELINTDTDLYKPDGNINKGQAQRNLTKERLRTLQEEYERLKDHPDSMYSGEFDEMIYQYIGILRDDYGNRDLRELSLDELQDLYDILRGIDETLQDARKLIGWGEMNGVYEAGDAIIAEQAEVTGKRKNGRRNAARRARDASLNLSLSPVRNVERMSGYKQDSALLKLFHRFEKGVRKKNKFIMDAYKGFDHLTSGKAYDQAVYDACGEIYTDINGRRFRVSRMQMMQAILSYERETANGMQHIEKGGFTFADLDLLRKGKLRDAISEEHAHRVPAAVGMVEEFYAFLRDDQWCQDYMTAARKFFDGTAKDAINETYLTLKHRILARDKNYIPFEVDKDFVVREISAANDVQQTITSYGMLKDTKKGAPQSLIITGLNNILDRHIEQVGTVYGLAVEVRNFNKVWNMRSESGDVTVKSSVRRNWGNEGIAHIEQAVQDIQGPRAKEQSALYQKVRSGYIGATFLLNLSVVSKQIGSLFTATSMLRWRNPVSQVANLLWTMINHKKISAEVDKYTATAWMRRQGLSDAELHTMVTEAKKPGFFRMLESAPAPVNPTKWITAMDAMVALSLWKYAKQDTAKRTGLEGEALLQATAEFYDDLIENTQSMSDMLHRPEIQKRGDIVSESFAMFKTDLYQMAGQLEVTAGRYAANRNKETAGALVRTVNSVAMSALWAQLMTTAFALMRYKVDQYRDDEDKDLTVESWLKRQGFSMAGDLMGYLNPIFGSELAGVFEQIEYGESGDVIDSVALTAINDLYDVMITTATAIKEGKLPNPAELKKLTTKALQMFGIPANNILRTFDAIRLHAEDFANGEFFRFEAGVERTAANHIHRIIEAANDGDEETARYLFGEAEQDLGDTSSLRTALGKKYKDGEVSAEIAEMLLSEFFGMEDDEIYWMLDKWDYAAENGSSEDYAKYDDFFAAVETGTELKATIKRYTDNGVEAKTLLSQLREHYKPLYVAMSTAEKANIKGYLLNAMTALGEERQDALTRMKEWEFESDTGIAWNDLKQAFMDGIISASRCRSALISVEGKTAEEANARMISYCRDAYEDGIWNRSKAKSTMTACGMTAAEAESRLRYIDIKNQFPDLDVDQSWVDKYYSQIQSSGISVEVYMGYRSRVKDVTGEGKKQRRVEIIHSLPITAAQKDALYLAEGWAKSGLADTPWH